MLPNLKTGQRAPLTGELRCTSCGNMLSVSEGASIPPCPRCNNTEFRKA